MFVATMWRLACQTAIDRKLVFSERNIYLQKYSFAASRATRAGGKSRPPRELNLCAAIDRLNPNGDMMRQASLCALCRDFGQGVFSPVCRPR